MAAMRSHSPVRLRQVSQDLHQDAGWQGVDQRGDRPAACPLASGPHSPRRHRLVLSIQAQDARCRGDRTACRCSRHRGITTPQLAAAAWQHGRGAHCHAPHASPPLTQMAPADRKRHGRYTVAKYVLAAEEGRLGRRRRFGPAALGHRPTQQCRAWLAPLFHGFKRLQRDPEELF